MELQALRIGGGVVGSMRMNTLEDNIVDIIFKLFGSNMKTKEDKQEFHWMYDSKQIFDRNKTVWFKIHTHMDVWMLKDWFSSNYNNKRNIMMLCMKVKKKPEQDAEMIELKIPLTDVHNMIGTVQQWENKKFKQSWDFYYWLPRAVETIVKQTWAQTPLNANTHPISQPPWG
jgi:hypothetical protein